MAQELQLSVEGVTPITEAFRDSLDFKQNHPNFESLKQEADTLLQKVQRMGYINSELRTLQKQNDSLYTARYFFGRRIDYIKVYYSEGSFRKKELQAIASEVQPEYFILPFQTAEAALQKLNSFQTASGNAFGRLRLSEITANTPNSLQAQLVLVNGSQRTIDGIVIKGYEKFPKSYLRYYAGIKKKTLFNQKKLIAQNELLNSLGFVSTLKPPEALFQKDSTTVYFYLQKKNFNNFDGILGFATDEETQRVQFNGYLNLELNNNLNFGEQLLINYKADGDEQVNFRAKTTLPYLFNTPFGLALELKIFKRDSTFVTTDQQARLTYQVTPRSAVYAGYKGYESSNLQDEVLVGNPVQDYTANYIIAGAAYEKPQNSNLFPIKTTAAIDTEIGTRELKDTQEDQIRLLFTANHIINLNTENSLYIQNTTQALLSDTYLTNELFRFGGINSIRGFNENSIDASLFSVLNTEYRYMFNPGLYIHSIIDLGYFENDIMELKQKLYSFGIGLGLQSKAGLFNINFANGNREGMNFNFSNTKIHISLTSRF